MHDQNDAASGMNNWVSLWKLPEEKRVRRFMMETEGYDEVHSLAFTPDGRLLAAGTLDGTIYLWQMPQVKLIGVLVAGGGTVVSLAFSPNGKKLAALVEKFWFHLWDVQTKKLLWERKHEGNYCF